MVARKDFLAKCEHWRSRQDNIPVGILADIYEGRVWRDFSSTLGRPFLSQPNNICLMFNMD